MEHVELFGVSMGTLGVCGISKKTVYSTVLYRGENRGEIQRMPGMAPRSHANALQPFVRTYENLFQISP